MTTTINPNAHSGTMIDSLIATVAVVTKTPVPIIPDPVPAPSPSPVPLYPNLDQEGGLL